MQTSADRSLHEAVLAALATTPRVDAGKVGIAVEEGVATLTGTLISFTERWAVEAAVKSVKGLCGIANELRISQELLS
jgi:osmotically-inducible protein OsmY